LTLSRLVFAAALVLAAPALGADADPLCASLDRALTAAEGSSIPFATMAGRDGKLTQLDGFTRCRLVRSSVDASLNCVAPPASGAAEAADPDAEAFARRAHACLSSRGYALEATDPEAGKLAIQLKRGLGHAIFNFETEIADLGDGHRSYVGMIVLAPFRPSPPPTAANPPRRTPASSPAARRGRASG
jgi:hypothetical protein